MTDENMPVPQAILNSVLDQKAQHIDSVLDPKLRKISARQDCYARITSEAKRQIGEYYETHPERALDQRGIDAENASLAGLRMVFDILDEYVISYREVKADEQHPATPQSPSSPTQPPADGPSQPGVQPAGAGRPE